MVDVLLHSVGNHRSPCRLIYPLRMPLSRGTPAMCVGPALDVYADIRKIILSKTPHDLESSSQDSQEFPFRSSAKKERDLIVA